MRDVVYGLLTGFLIFTIIWGIAEVVIPVPPIPHRIDVRECTGNTFAVANAVKTEWGDGARYIWTQDGTLITVLCGVVTEYPR